MNIEFHYHMMYAIALRAGYNADESYKIAYASQHTDDNVVDYDVWDADKTEKYRVDISQTMDITRPKADLERIYRSFHFVAGRPNAGSTTPSDLCMHDSDTTPNSDRCTFLLGAALDSKDVYQIGLATHCFADAYAHANFSYQRGRVNALPGLVKRVIPNFGHADALSKPDIPGRIWKDKRLSKDHQEVHNKERFLDAAESIFRMLKESKHPDCTTIDQECAELREAFSWAIGDEFSGIDKCKQERIERYKKIIIEFAGGDESAFKDYDKNAWRKQAIKGRVRGLPDRLMGPILRRFALRTDLYTWKPGHEDSDWYKFQQAVKVHFERADGLYEDFCDDNGIEFDR